MIIELKEKILGYSLANMKELEDLTNAELSVLMMAYKKLNKSIKCHQQKQRILNSVVDIRPNLKKKAFDKLVSNGFLRKHPTRKSTTYELTYKGKKAADQHLRDDLYN